MKQVKTILNEEERKEERGKQIRWILMIFMITLFVGQIVYGFFKVHDPNYDYGQAKLIVAQGFGGIAVSLAPLLLDMIFGVRMHLNTIIVIYLYGLLGIFVGETFKIYYKLSWWDDFLHALSGVAATFGGTGLVYALLKNSNMKYKRAFSLFVGFTISLTVALLWETMEFSMDSLFGVNAQKTIPEDPAFFNGGSSLANLKGTDEEIAAFFRTPAGYRYALIDTMSDLIECLVGSGLTVTVYALILGFTGKEPWLTITFEKSVFARKKEKLAEESKKDHQNQDNTHRENA